jgi:hypothetical protein
MVLFVLHQPIMNLFVLAQPERSAWQTNCYEYVDIDMMVDFDNCWLYVDKHVDMANNVHDNNKIDEKEHDEMLDVWLDLRRHKQTD